MDHLISKHPKITSTIIAILIALLAWAAKEIWYENKESNDKRFSALTERTNKVEGGMFQVQQNLSAISTEIKLLNQKIDLLGSATLKTSTAINASAKKHKAISAGAISLKVYKSLEGQGFRILKSPDEKISKKDIPPDWQWIKSKTYKSGPANFIADHTDRNTTNPVSKKKNK